VKYTAEMTAIGIWEQDELFVISRRIGDLMPDHVHSIADRLTEEAQTNDVPDRILIVNGTVVDDFVP
jgi:hypothetical protein